MAKDVSLKDFLFPITNRLEAEIGGLDRTPRCCRFSPFARHDPEPFSPPDHHLVSSRFASSPPSDRSRSDRASPAASIGIVQVVVDDGNLTLLNLSVGHARSPLDYGQFATRRHASWRYNGWYPCKIGFCFPCCRFSLCAGVVKLFLSVSARAGGPVDARVFHLANVLVGTVVSETPGRLSVGESMSRCRRSKKLLGDSQAFRHSDSFRSGRACQTGLSLRPLSSPLPYYSTIRTRTQLNCMCALVQVHASRTEKRC